MITSVRKEGLLSLLNKSLLRRRLEQVVELQPGSHHLLLLRIVSTVLRSFPPGHVEEYDQADQSHKEHSSGQRGNDQTGPLFINYGREVVWNVKNLETGGLDVCSYEEKCNRVG